MAVATTTTKNSFSSNYYFRLARKKNILGSRDLSDFFSRLWWSFLIAHLWNLHTFGMLRSVNALSNAITIRGKNVLSNSDFDVQWFHPHWLKVLVALFVHHLNRLFISSAYLKHIENSSTFGINHTIIPLYFDGNLFFRLNHFNANANVNVCVLVCVCVRIFGYMYCFICLCSPHHHKNAIEERNFGVKSVLISTLKSI